MIELLHGNNIDILYSCFNKRYLKFNLIYLDPPFNTQKKQSIHGKSYTDTFTKEQYRDMLYPVLTFSRLFLTENGSLFLHLDQHSKFIAKQWLDEIFGEQCFMNEIIWAYDYGGRTKKKWAEKHDTIFWYAKNPKDYIYNFEVIDRIPYLSKLCGTQKYELGKVPTDVWTMTIEPTNSKERVNYPTQKPLKLLKRIISTHSNKGDLIGDFFAGSGTTGRACQLLERDCVLIDSNPQAIEVIKKRLEL